MIRLQPTGIDVSQSDLKFHLQQLDIYQGLLKQGFRKSEIVQYFESQNARPTPIEVESEDSVIAKPSGRESCTEKSVHSSEESSSQDARSPPRYIGGYANFPQSDVAGQFRSIPGQDFPTTFRKGLPEEHRHIQNHAPRQSSLLRYARGTSSKSPSEDQGEIKASFSPRSNITYRRRSGTYSYDQSERDVDDADRSEEGDTTLHELEHLSLDQELIPPSEESGRTTIRVVSSLRPEAESFTPLLMRLESSGIFSNGKRKDDRSPSSDEVSLPISPPLLPRQQPSKTEYTLPSLPGAPHTLPSQSARPSSTADQHVLHQYLDGAFTVYNDSVPARLQPQTPVDLSRNRRLYDFDAAFTAPPGIIRSPLRSQGRILHNSRQASGDVSPVARAMLLRERRHREFTRGARIEGLMINRVRDAGTTQIVAVGDGLGDFWRDNLDADAVGEENVEDPSLLGAFRRLRTVSGNRRAH